MGASSDDPAGSPSPERRTTRRGDEDDEPGSYTRREPTARARATVAAVTRRASEPARHRGAAEAARRGDAHRATDIVAFAE